VAPRAESLGIRTGRGWTSEPFEPKLTRPAFILVNGHLPYLLRLAALLTWHARHGGRFVHVAHTLSDSLTLGFGVGRDDLSVKLSQRHRAQGRYLPRHRHVDQVVHRQVPTPSPQLGSMILRNMSNSLTLAEKLARPRCVRQEDRKSRARRQTEGVPRTSAPLHFLGSRASQYLDDASAYLDWAMVFSVSS
jgi:hypothetical protein